MLHVLGLETQETGWNTILSYFLNPTEPHGFSTDLLKAFLLALESNTELEFDFDRLDPGKLDVRSEWVMRDLGVRPDITIYSERSWFLIIEMKVGSSEHEDQTLDYVRSEKIGTIDKSEFGEKNKENEQRIEEREKGKKGNHNYVYLAPKSAASAKATGFTNISWREVVEQLEEFEHQSYGRYPTRSHAQLDDFLDTIRRELYMTDEKIEQDEIDKMQLYFEYAETFSEAEDALDNVQKRERKMWQERFLNDFKPPGWNDEKWRCRGDFAHIYRTEWQLTESGEQTDNGGAPYRISFTHDISGDPFRRGFLTFQLYYPRGADNDFTDEFNERFHND